MELESEMRVEVLKANGPTLETEEGVDGMAD